MPNIPARTAIPAAGRINFLMTIPPYFSPLITGIRESRATTVSYTHLDVYKRQALDGRLSMEQLEELDTGESESVQRAYRARDAAGGVSGYAIQMQVRGYGGPMTVWVALTADGHRFLGLRVTEQQETENLGSRVTE